MSIYNYINNSVPQILFLKIFESFNKKKDHSLSTILTIYKDNFKIYLLGLKRFIKLLIRS